MGYPKLSKVDINGIIIFIDRLEEPGRREERFKQVIIDEKPLPYLISSYGRVLSLNYAGHGKIKFLKQKTSKSGYKEVVLSSNKRCYYVLVHRLVADAFIKNPKNKPEVNHKDGIKNHNYEWNLEWNTSKENIIHSYKFNLREIRRGEDITDSKFTEEMVRNVCKLLVKNKHSFKEIAEKTGVTYDMVRNIRSHRSWTHISKDYDFDHYNGGKGKGYEKKKENRIRKICKLLESGKYSTGEISRMLDCKISEVYGIAAKGWHSGISKDYQIDNYVRKR